MRYDKFAFSRLAALRKIHDKIQVVSGTAPCPLQHKSYRQMRITEPKSLRFGETNDDNLITNNVVNKD